MSPMTDQKINDPADLLPGDYLLSGAVPGTWLTVTNTPRSFLGYWDVDYRTASGAQGTVHFKAGTSLARRCAFRPSA